MKNKADELTGIISSLRGGRRVAYERDRRYLWRRNINIWGNSNHRNLNK